MIQSGLCNEYRMYDISPPPNFDTSTRTSVRASKMNAVVRAQLTFQMLTFLLKYLSAGQMHMCMSLHLHIKRA